MGGGVGHGAVRTDHSAIPSTIVAIVLIGIGGLCLDQMLRWIGTQVSFRE
jgi:hypothetical protein